VVVVVAAVALGGDHP
jgi:hypothetical protein